MNRKRRLFTRFSPSWKKSFFCYHDACLPGFHQWHFFVLFNFFVFFLFLIFCIFECFHFFWYYQGAYLLGFHQDNRFFSGLFAIFRFFQDLLQFLDFFRTCKYVHGSSETKSAVEPLQVKSVDRLLEHLSFGC